MSISRTPQIFVSYSRNDQEIVQKISAALKERGFNIWIDSESILPGTKWSTAVHSALNSCDAMLVIISEDAMASQNVEDEWQYFLDENKPIVPILWKPTKVHFQLKRIQYIDFHSNSFEQSIELLYIALKNRFPEAKLLRHTSDAPEQVWHALEQINSLMPSPFDWVIIPNGLVTLAPVNENDIGTIHQVSEFAIGKFPITNLQYQIFLDQEDGYSDQAWWQYSELALRWRKQRPLASLVRPAPTMTIYSDDNKPCIDIAWYDAMAFCQWLTYRLLAAIPIANAGTTIKITLPTEQQWQRAAQGDDGRTYPWGNISDFTRCNCRETSVRHPTPVDQFSKGVSPFGVFDMCGNAWEWCLSDLPAQTQTDDDIRFPARGGSYANPITPINYRSNWHPTERLIDEGFRIVAILDSNG